MHHKKRLKAELALWHFIADSGPMAAVGRATKRGTARLIGVIAIIGSLAIGATAIGLFLNATPTAVDASSVPPVSTSHVAKHRALPHSEHLHKTKTATVPGSHLHKHHRDYVIVRSGDSLWTIAQRYLAGPTGSTPSQLVQIVQHLEQINDLSNASVLEVGQRIHI